MAQYGNIMPKSQVQTKLVESLPRSLKGSLPTVAEVEAELDNARAK
jgi:hypothetical protein